MSEQFEFNEEDVVNQNEVREILKEWQEIYGDIFVTTIHEEDFIYRLMSYKEYNNLKNLSIDNYELEELVCEAAVLDPIVDFTDSIYAGYTSSLAIDILKNSHILTNDEEESLIQKIDKEYEYLKMDLKEQIPLIIKHCFQEFTLKDIEAMPLPQQIVLLNKARWMLEVIEGNPINFDTGEEG